MSETISLPFVFRSEDPMESRGGRPYKFGEPTVRREFRFPESLSARLTKFAQNRGEDVSDFVRYALEYRMDLGSTSGIVKHPDDILKKDELKEMVSSAVQDVIREERQSDTIPVRLREADRERLARVAEAIGYVEPADLIEDVMRNLLRRPGEISEMLLGHGIRALQQTLQDEGRSDLAAAGQAEKAKLDEKLGTPKTPAKRTVKKVA